MSTPSKHDIKREPVPARPLPQQQQQHERASPAHMELVQHYVLLLRIKPEKLWIGLGEPKLTALSAARRQVEGLDPPPATVHCGSLDVEHYVTMLRINPAKQWTGLEGPALVALNEARRQVESGESRPLQRLGRYSRRVRGCSSGKGGFGHGRRVGFGNLGRGEVPVLRRIDGAPAVDVCTDRWAVVGGKDLEEKADPTAPWKKLRAVPEEWEAQYRTTKAFYDGNKVEFTRAWRMQKARDQMVRETAAHDSAVRTKSVVVSQSDLEAENDPSAPWKKLRAAPEEWEAQYPTTKAFYGGDKVEFTRAWRMQKMRDEMAGLTDVQARVGPSS
ncbi:hypothetical protein LTR22_017421 [Elasticomyces elasticus]|nr:hypothetical protein LTR22_017421 [Elasticomyces elasticus]KAK4924572.1 hypothetical protein LTR49_008255 [Elasticomyces elasticus]